MVGADGRGSRVRRLAGIEPVKTSPPMDVLWFKLPREPEDPEGIVGRFGRGHIAVMLDRDDHWQAGYVIPKGTFPELRHEGIGELKRQFAELIPEFADRAGAPHGLAARSRCSRSSRAAARRGTGRVSC